MPELPRSQLELLEPLQWDTEFFGFPVARIVNPRASIDELRDATSQMRQKQIPLAYWAADNPEIDVQKSAISLGGCLVDKKLTFLTGTGQSPNTDIPALALVESFQHEMPLVDLKQLAIEASVYSRFVIDQKFPQEKARALFEEWIVKSVKGDLADEVLVIRQGTRVVGMLTLARKEGRSSIGLLAVAADCRGQRFGEALVCAAQLWSRQNCLAQIQVITQQANVTACRFYQKCGFELEKTESVYHFWV